MRMKRAVSACLLALLLLLCATVLADDGFIIRDEHFEGTLSKDNVMHVELSMDIDYLEPRHGPLQSVRTSFEVGTDAPEIGGKGVMAYRAQVRNVSVEGAPFTTENSDDGALLIRIGDPDVTVTGLNSYVIRYDYIMPDNRLETCDFLFYSFIGAETTSNVDHFTFHLNFEKPIPESAISSMRMYSGDAGSFGNDLNVTPQISETEMSGEVSDLLPGQAVTTLIILPNGYFEGAEKTSIFPGLIAALVSFALSILVGAKSLLTVRNDPVQTVEFYPPEGIDSAQAAMILDEKAEDTAMLSLIPGWGKTGHLTMEQVKSEKGILIFKKMQEGIILHLKKELPNEAPDYQKTLFNGIFMEGDDLDLRDPVSLTFASRLDKAKKQLTAHFSGEHALSKGKGTAFGAILLTLVGYGLMVMFSSQISTFEYLVPGIVSIVFPLFGAMFYWYASIYMQHNKLMRILSVVVLGGCLAATAAIGLMFMQEGLVLPSVVYYVAFGIMSASLFLTPRIVVMTEYKKELVGKILGLREFIRVAEQDKLEMLVKDNPEYFFDILPYAMAFGMADVWAEQFANLTIQPPDWYYGYAGYWNYRYMDRVMVNSLRGSMQEMRTRQYAEAARSSGSSGGGGGFSGGGGGGGGTSSW